MLRLSLVAVSRGLLFDVVLMLLMWWLLLLQSMGSSTGSVIVTHGLCCPVGCGTFPTRDQTPVTCIGRQILNH